MSIRFEGERNMLSSKVQTIVCPVNTVGVMGAGLALAMRNRIPGLFAFYRAACLDKSLTVGTLLVYPIPNTKQQVLLFPTKVHWSKPSKLAWITKGLETLERTYEALGIEEVAFPPVGCGLGQLDYTKDLKPELYRVFEESELPVEIHLFRQPN